MRFCLARDYRVHKQLQKQAYRIAGNFDGWNLTFFTLSSLTVKIKPVKFLSQYTIW